MKILSAEIIDKNDTHTICKIEVETESYWSKKVSTHVVHTDGRCSLWYYSDTGGILHGLGDSMDAFVSMGVKNFNFNLHN